MNRKGSSQSQEDPYQVIRKLRLVVEEQQKQLEEYQMVCDSVTFEKGVAVNEIANLKREIEYLSQRFTQQKTTKSIMGHSSSANLFQTRVFSKQNKHYLNTLSPQLGKNDLVSSHFVNLSSPSEGLIKKESKYKEFIPNDVVFTSKQKQKLIDGHINLNQSSSEHQAAEKVGEFLIEDFLVVSPDIIELKKMKQSKKDDVELTIDEFYYFNYNPTYKNKKGEYLKDIAKRSFPLGASVNRKLIDTFQEFRQELQFITAGKMGQEYFILNLKGDLADNQSKEGTFIQNCNPYKALFAVCLRVPDFIPIRDQKYFQKQEQQVWKVEKIYAILTYYPFFNIHVSVLAKIHNLLQPQWHKLQRDELLSKNLQRNLSQIQKSEHINKLINYLISKKPDYNQAIMHDNHYFGAVPSSGFASQYAITRFACPIFFSVFAYEEMLLLITAIFLQKSIIFVSKSQSAATLCALFLTTIISPFKYNQHLILNCDNQKIDTIVFQFPFILIATIKKADNFPNILKAFIDNNNDRFKGFDNKNPTGPLVLVDIDSNCIFYDTLLNKVFQELIVSPSEELKEAYLVVNQSVSKTFSFPKKMPVQVSFVPKNDYQKNEQIRRKIQKEYQQKIDNNLSKWPTYEFNSNHAKVLRLLTEYIQSFGINSDYQYQMIKSTVSNNQARKAYARKHLLSKHLMRAKLVNVIVESQLFADYLDDLQKKMEDSK